MKWKEIAAIVIGVLSGYGTEWLIWDQPTAIVCLAGGAVAVAVTFFVWEATA